jgi:O-antigen chain-terminating methyltransferase
MIETGDTEIDIDQLMVEIREAVARREARGARSLISATMELYDSLLNAEELPTDRIDVPQISLQPELVLKDDDHYHVNDLVKFHDHAFVWNAYKVILKREPDEEGLRQFLGNLRSGRSNKIDVLASLRRSPEGETKGVRVDGLRRPALLRRFYRVPVLGYLLELLVAIARLPAQLRNQRSFEGHVSAQHDRLAGQLNELSRHSFQFSDSFSRELAKTGEEQRRYAGLQHQQIVGLFREQRELSARLRKLEAGRNGSSVNAPQTMQAISEASSQEVSSQEASHPKAGDAAGRAFDELLASFAAEFRGDAGKIKEGLRFYLPYVKADAVEKEMLDLGCGRGEWLELLREEGIRARGVESNHILAEGARSRGLEVVEQDALRFLREQPTNSFGAITAFHLVEHLPFETLAELLAEIERTLRPGGLVILETPNPKNLVVAACNFYADPTHQKPVFPETLLFLLEQKGFVELKIEYLNPVEESPFDKAEAASQALDTWFFGPRDFALIGRKRGRIVKHGQALVMEEKDTIRPETTAEACPGGAPNRPL